MNNKFRLLIAFLLLTNIGYVLYILPRLPDIIPTHFNASGTIDGWGSKYSIFMLIGIQVLLNVLLEYAAMHPEKHNYIGTITDENRDRQYAASANLIRKLNVAVSVIFLTISFAIVQQKMPTALIIIELVALFALIIGHLIRSSKTR